VTLKQQLLSKKLYLLHATFWFNKSVFEVLLLSGRANQSTEWVRQIKHEVPSAMGGTWRSHLSLRHHLAVNNHSEKERLLRTTKHAILSWELN
jgi:hypothetical protein